MSGTICRAPTHMVAVWQQTVASLLGLIEFQCFETQRPHARTHHGLLERQPKPRITAELPRASQFLSYRKACGERPVIKKCLGRCAQQSFLPRFYQVQGMGTKAQLRRTFCHALRAPARASWTPIQHRFTRGPSARTHARVVGSKVASRFIRHHRASRARVVGSNTKVALRDKVMGEPAAAHESK